MTYHDLIHIPDRSAPVPPVKLPSMAPLVAALVLCAVVVIVSSVILLNHASHR